MSGDLSNGDVVLVATTPTSNNGSTFGLTVYISYDDGASWTINAKYSYSGSIDAGVATPGSSAMRWLTWFFVSFSASPPGTSIIERSIVLPLVVPIGNWGIGFAQRAHGTAMTWVVSVSNQALRRADTSNRSNHQLFQGNGDSDLGPTGKLSGTVKPAGKCSPLFLRARVSRFRVLLTIQLAS